MVQFGLPYLDDYNPCLLNLNICTYLFLFIYNVYYINIIFLCYVIEFSVSLVLIWESEFGICAVCIDLWKLLAVLSCFISRHMK